MNRNNSIIDFDFEPTRKKLEPYIVTASINDLNLNSDFIRKMESKKEVNNYTRNSGHGHSRLDETGNTRSIDIPVPSTPPSHPRMAEKKYWKISFRIVLLPLLLLGIPAHLTLMKRPIKTRQDWLRGLINLRNFGSLILSIVIFICSVALNVYVLKNIVEMFIILIINGEINPVIFLNFIYLVQNLPIIIPMTFIWVWGYVLRDLILSFSRPSLSDSFLQNPDIFHGNVPKLPGRVKLIIMYILIAFIHTIHIYLYSARLTKGLPDTISVLTHFLNYFIGPVYSTLVLPVYATFCWACHRHYTILSNYIQTLINMRSSPDVAYFNRFKLAFKELSDRVQLVNNLFSLYFSWVIVNVLMSLYVEAWDLANVFFASISPVAEGSDEGSEGDPTPSTENGTIRPFPTPELVRSFVGFLFIIFLKVVLLGFTFWQAVRVNDMARGLNIWLNDLLTEPNANVSVDNYHAFRLLKFYVRSRMQQPRPALLRIPILGCIPVLKARLSPIFIDQY